MRIKSRFYSANKKSNKNNMRKIVSLFLMFVLQS